MNAALSKVLVEALTEHPERCHLTEAQVHADGSLRVTIEVVPAKQYKGVLSLVMSDGVQPKDYVG